MGRGHEARVSHAGELVTIRGNYDTAYFASMTATATAYNLVEPKDQSTFVITALIINADKNVSATDGAVVVLLEGDSTTDTSGTKTLLTLNIGKNETSVITGILINTTRGKYLNVTTDDATVNITLLGYYLEADESTL